MFLFLTTLRRELNSIKSFLVVIFFIIIAIILGKYSTSVAILIDAKGNSALIDLLFGIYGFLGYLFSAVLFSGIIADEVNTQTMRYLVPYVSKKKIYLAKYFASLAYFLIIVSISLIILFVYRKTIVLPPFAILSVTIFFAYIQALVMLVSVIAPNGKTATFINLVIGICLPILYSLAFLKKWFILKIIQYFLPYYYLAKQWDNLGLLLIVSVIVFGGIFLFEGKEV